MLERALEELGVGNVEITERYIEDFEEAQKERFLGSPSIRISDQEAVEGIHGQGYGLTCRIYHKSDGKISPLPEYEVLLSGLGRFLTN